MKKVFNKTFAIVAIAFAMVLAIFGGIFFTGHNEVASADGKDVTVKLSADTKTFTQGTTFELTVSLNSNIQNAIFDSITLNVGVVNASKDGFDAAKSANLTFTPNSSRVVFKKSTNISNTSNFKDQSTINNADYDNKGNALISIANFAGIELACTEEITFKIKVTIAADVVDDTQFELGVLQQGVRNGYTYLPNGTTQSENVYASDSSKFEVQTLKFTVRKPKSDKNLSALEVGQGDDMQEITGKNFATDSDIDVTLTDPTAQVTIKPTVPSDSGATIYVKKPGDSGDGTEITSGSSESFDIPADGKLTIVVKAEDGTKKEYNLTLKVVGATLTKLTVKSDTKTAGVTEGVKEVFDSKTKSYTVLIPSDATKATINATVSTGHSEKTTLALATLGTGTVASSTVASGTDFDMTGIVTGDKLTITASADDSNGHTSTTEYTLTFKVVSVDTAITLTITGQTSHKTFTSDADKAKENTVDYYYIITGETNAASTAVITFPATATEKKLNGTEYTSSVNLTAGTHTITVKAEAGNTKTYNFILKAYTAIKLKTGITADFIFEEEVSGGKYRRTYAEKGKVHGVDDLDFDRLVIGQIETQTTVTDFLKNFDTTIANAIKLYKADDTLVYDKGAAQNGFNLNDSDSGVGTGWKLEYIVDGAVEETIYLSVLGDMDGDGYANAIDVACMGNVIKNVASYMTTFNEKTEIRLAGYVNNTTGEIQAADIATVGRHIRGVENVSSMFYKAS